MDGNQDNSQQEAIDLRKKFQEQMSTYGGGVSLPKIKTRDQMTPQELLDDKVRRMYGAEADKLSQGVETYMGGLRSALDKNVAEADIYNQQAARQRGIAKTRAGLSGVDTSAADEQARRNAIYGAQGINEAAKRQALTSYGKGVGNIITGLNKVEQQAEANRLASMGTPVPESKSGMLDEIFGWLI